MGFGRSTPRAKLLGLPPSCCQTRLACNFMWGSAIIWQSFSETSKMSQTLVFSCQKSLLLFFMARFRCDLCGESCDFDGKLKYSAVSRPRTIFVTSHICSFVAEFFLHCVCAKTTTHFDVFFSLSLGLLEKKAQLSFSLPPPPPSAAAVSMHWPTLKPARPPLA